MTDTASTPQQVQPHDIKRVPQDPGVRSAIRDLAATASQTIDRARPPARPELERHARSLLDRLALPEDFLGFAMVAVSNAFWRPQFEGVRFQRRLLFLPCCLRDQESCLGDMDSSGLTCRGCGACVLGGFKETAERLGYRVIIAEGTPAVVQEFLDCDADAILGVACLDSLEKAFGKIADLGIPHVAVPLLKDGCVDTEAEADEVLAVLGAAGAMPAAQTRTYAPLLREAVRSFEPAALRELIAPELHLSSSTGTTDAIALEWLEAGGKRFRPFITLAAYTVSRHGANVLAPDADLAGLIPASVRKLAAAIETLHKASLVHDDIEDDDVFRYGRHTLHQEYGIGPAINIGDFLIGLGYRLVAGQSDSLGPACAADVLSHLASAHLQLCRGQGAELLWQQEGRNALRPVDALETYALKTAPAFETALYAGLRAAHADVPVEMLRRFAIYLGEAYQILNDLDDWDRDHGNKRVSGLDVLAERPTLLRALALQAGAGDALTARAGDTDGIRSLYEQHGVFERARRLADKLRDRAIALAETTERPGLKDLLLFIIRTVL